MAAPINHDLFIELESSLKSNGIDINDPDNSDSDSDVIGLLGLKLFKVIGKSGTKCHLKFDNGQQEMKKCFGFNHYSLFERVVSFEANDVKIVPDAAFLNCDALESISLSSAEIIGDGAFMKLNKLKEISLPKAKKIGELGYSDNNVGAFNGCKELAKVELPSAQTIGQRTFLGCYSLEKLVLPRAETIGVRAFMQFKEGCERLSKIILPKVKKIEEEAFWNCKNISEVIIPEVEEIQLRAFCGCGKIKDISLDNVTIIGPLVFAECEALETVYMPKVVNIGKEAFANCLNLRKVLLPYSADVSEDAFKNCGNVSLSYVDRDGTIMPTIKTVASSPGGATLFIDMESRTWDNKSISSFFDELDRQKKTLDYALTMDLWEPEEDIPIASGMKFDVEAAYKNIKANITSDFGDEVICTRQEAVFLHSMGQSKIEDKGLFLSRRTKGGLDYAGLYVIILAIGLKKLTVQIYTLYLSQGKDAVTEGQQAIALKQNADPVHGRIIRALRVDILQSIEQTANLPGGMYSAEEE
jgi:hypothetical protein